MINTYTVHVLCQRLSSLTPSIMPAKDAPVEVMMGDRLPCPAMSTSSHMPTSSVGLGFHSGPDDTIR